METTNQQGWKQPTNTTTITIMQNNLCFNDANTELLVMHLCKSQKK